MDASEPAAVLCWANDLPQHLKASVFKLLGSSALALIRLCLEGAHVVHPIG